MSFLKCSSAFWNSLFSKICNCFGKMLSRHLKRSIVPSICLPKNVFLISTNCCAKQINKWETFLKTQRNRLFLKWHVLAVMQHFVKWSLPFLFFLIYFGKWVFPNAVVLCCLMWCCVLHLKDTVVLYLQLSAKGESIEWPYSAFLNTKLYRKLSLTSKYWGFRNHRTVL